jgi:hypothetical protein
MRLLATLALACALVPASAAAADSGSTQVSVTIGHNGGARSVAASARPTGGGEARYTVTVDERLSVGHDWSVIASVNGAEPVVILEQRGAERPEAVYTQSRSRTWTGPVPRAGVPVVLTLIT